MNMVNQIYLSFSDKLNDIFILKLMTCVRNYEKSDMNWKCFWIIRDQIKLDKTPSNTNSNFLRKLSEFNLILSTLFTPPPVVHASHWHPTPWRIWIGFQSPCGWFGRRHAQCFPALRSKAHQRMEVVPAALCRRKRDQGIPKSKRRGKKSKTGWNCQKRYLSEIWQRKDRLQVDTDTDWHAHLGVLKHITIAHIN